MNMASEQGGVPTFLSTHPDPGDRFNAVNQSASMWQDSLAFNSWKVNQESYLHLIDGIIYGEDPRQGYVEGYTFYHPQLKLKFLSRRLATGKLAGPGQYGSKDGKALMVFAFAPGGTLQESAWATFNKLGLNALQSKNTTVNGMPALVTISRQVSQDQSTGQQQTIKVLSYFITYNGVNYVFHGVTAEADFNAYTHTFESTMLNFGKLTDPAKLNVKPKKILVRPVMKAGSVSDAFKALELPRIE